jgi:hypothetical protein
MAGVGSLQVGGHILHARVHMVALTAWLDVDRPDHVDPIAKQLTFSELNA